jgi:ribose 5-phosphate isomerase B
MNIKNIVIGSDHAGFEYKERIIAYLRQHNILVTDVGPHNTGSVDYPDYGHKVANIVLKDEMSMGIVICGSGNGIAMSVNKHQGIRCALCWAPEITSLARQHNNANVLAIPARFITIETTLEMVHLFINTAFEGGRHQTRVNKIDLN